MRVNAPSLAVGIAIGVVALSVPLIYMTTQLSTEGDDRQPQAAFFLGGYLQDLSEDSMTLNQVANEEGLDVDELRDVGIRVRIEPYTHIQCAAGSGAGIQSECVQLYQAGEIAANTSVCAFVHLIDNRLHGSKIFIGAVCDMPPKV